MATIEELLAIINDNPRSIIDMSDEELLKVLAPCLILEPKTLNKPAVSVVTEAAEETEPDDPNPFKITKKKSKKERLNKVLSEADKLFEELES